VSSRPFNKKLLLSALLANFCICITVIFFEGGGRRKAPELLVQWRRSTEHRSATWLHRCVCCVCICVCVRARAQRLLALTICLSLTLT
jgi:hypothetical protein